jgi:hypothetical protein
VLVGSLETTTIYRVHLGSPKLTALVYPDFDTSALPRLSERTKVDLQGNDVQIYDHTGEGRASVLTDKSRYMSGDEERYQDQVAFDRALRDLFGEGLARVPHWALMDGMRKAGIEPPYLSTMTGVRSKPAAEK